MKTVLITGSRGFTGVYVANHFENAGYKVIRSVTTQPHANEVQCDLTDKTAVNDLMVQTKPTGIIHLAAMSFVAHGDESAFYQINTVGTTNLLQAVDTAGLNPEKIIIASSANVYGNPTVDVVSETMPLNPISHYAASKLAMEAMVKTWYERFPIAVVRPFNYTGVGQDKKFLVPKIVSHYAQNKKTIELGNLDVARDFSDVRDIATAYFNLFESSVQSDVVNFCSGNTVTLADMIQWMNTLAGYEIEVTVNPDFVRKNEIKILCGDNRKMQDLLRVVPSIPFVETLRGMYLAGND
ncbi:MAG: GDP-mannose 4,6-dehydratase [Methylococcales bacterium]|nr:GDP-mannose 4,6-dehydratase [Methylococcales bacterium]